MSETDIVTNKGRKQVGSNKMCGEKQMNYVGYMFYSFLARVDCYLLSHVKMTFLFHLHTNI